MKIFTAEQLGQADQKTLQSEAISSLELMERAASRALNQLLPRLRKEIPINIFVGIGNNGGDGLVIARKLIREGFEVEVFVVEYSTTHSPELTRNLERLKTVSSKKVRKLHEGGKLPKIPKNGVVIDAMFGIGLNRPLLDWVADIVDHINTSGAFSVAIDMPTGLFSDRIPSKDQSVLQADLTLTFQCPKLVFFLPETAEFTGKVKVIDIGLDQTFLAKTSTEYELVTQDEARSLLKPRKRFSHKGNYGHCLVVGGSYGKMGSIVLTTRAGLRSGAGKVTTWAPRCGYEILQTAVPEAMVIPPQNEKILNDFDELSFTPEVVCFGMGSGTAEETRIFFKTLMSRSSVPMLIDADGLNLLARDKTLCDLIPEGSVLTPHPKELERLIGPWSDDFDKLEKAKRFVKDYGCVLVLKDAITLIVTTDKIYINSTGNPGMATAGSGDVLSGLIGGLMAQGYSPGQAAILGVYVHGKAGDIAVQNSSEESLIAGDLIHNFGRAFCSLHKTRVKGD